MMRKTSHLTRISLMLAVMFGADKLLGVFRTIVIGRQFGLSADLDVFNAANNLPDMLFALISGGALAIAFIPVLSEVLSKDGREKFWRLFSGVANLAFLVTGGLAVLVAILAEPLVSGELGIAPGFDPGQQAIAVRLMRLNLISTLVFSISGLVMASLQANQHFIFPALAPIIYDLGQIFGAVVLAPAVGYSVAGFQLPAFNLGIDGLVYGVIIGAGLHLLIQVPGLIKYRFRWFLQIDLKDTSFKKVLRLMGPRLISMVFIQLIFLARDNLASRLSVGSVTALSYGWWIQQVPETLIGTAIGTALLPTLSEHFSKGDKKAFIDTIERSLKVMIALSFPAAVILSLGSLPLIQFAFGFPLEDAQMILWATQGYLVGLLGHSAVELGVRAFYAKQNARVPMIISGAGLLVYIVLAVILMGSMAAGGIALANSISYSVQGLLLFVLLNRQNIDKFAIRGTFFRSILAAGAAGFCVWLILNGLPFQLSPLYLSVIAILFGGVVAVIPIWREIRLLMKL